METEETVFEKNYKDYLAQIENISLKSIALNLGGKVQGCVIEIPLFGENYEVSSAGIIGPAGKTPTYDICVILSKYLLLCPDEPPKQDEWVSFRDLKDSGPLINYFSNDVENSIAAYFKGKLDGLRKASKALSGYPPDLDVRYDIAMQFDALPRIPVIIFFNDADEEFSEKCSVLFEKRAERYLDAECIAMLGREFFRHLKRAYKKQ